MLMTSNMITHSYFPLLVFEFKPKFIDKYSNNYIINQVIDQFCFKSRPNNTPTNLSFENSEFRHTNLTYHGANIFRLSVENTK